MVGDAFELISLTKGILVVKHKGCGRAYVVNNQGNFFRSKNTNKDIDDRLFKFRRCDKCGKKESIREEYHQYKEFKDSLTNKNKGSIPQFDFEVLRTLYQDDNDNEGSKKDYSNYTVKVSKKSSVNDVKKYKTKRKTTESYKQDLKNKYGDEYSLVSEYIRSTVKVSIRHNKCGLVKEVYPSAFLGGKYKCNCSNGNKPYISTKLKTDEEFKEQVKEMVGDEYIFLDSYVNNKTPLKVIHNVEGCMNVYEVSPNNFLKGIVGSKDKPRRCPKCNKTSLEELEITQYLNDKGINFQREFACVKNDITNRYLRYDFAIFNSDNKLLGLIEYDSPYHYNRKNKTGVRDRDEIKTSYAKDKGIPLLRIGFYEDNYLEKVENFCNQLLIEDNKKLDEIKSSVELDRKITLNKDKGRGSSIISLVGKLVKNVFKN